MSRKKKRSWSQIVGNILLRETRKLAVSSNLLYEYYLGIEIKIVFAYESDSWNIESKTMSVNNFIDIFLSHC